MGRTRKKNDKYQEPVFFAYDHAQLTADTEIKLLKCDRPFRLDKVEIVNPTGLAVDAANFYNIKILNVTQTDKVMANWSTETGQEGALVADAYATMAQAADPTAAKGDEISVLFDETGTQTLPPGRLHFHGRYL